MVTSHYVISDMKNNNIKMCFNFKEEINIKLCHAKCIYEVNKG